MSTVPPNDRQPPMRENGDTDLDQSLKLAHQPKERNCDLNGISDTGSPAGPCQEINIYLVPLNRRGRYRAELADGTVLCLSRQPFLDAARALISAGFAPDLVLICWRRGSANWALRATLGEAAKLTVDETKTCFARWKPFSSSAVCPPVRFSVGAAASLAAGAANSPVGPPDDADQQDIRRRPRTGDARTLSLTDRAAAGFNNAETLSTTSREEEPACLTDEELAPKR